MSCMSDNEITSNCNISFLKELQLIIGSVNESCRHLSTNNMFAMVYPLTEALELIFSLLFPTISILM